MNGYLTNAGVFLIKTIFGLILLAFVLRFLFQLSRADFRNPVSQFLVKFTNPLLVPLRRVIPGLFGIDIASVVVIIAIQALELFLIATIAGVSLSPAQLGVITVAELLDFIIMVYLFAIIVQVIISWVNPGSYNPVANLLYQLNAPLLRPAQRMLPSMGGFDLSPLVVAVMLQLISMLIVAPLSDWGHRLS